MRDDIEGHTSRAQTAEHFGAHDLVPGIALSVLHRPSEAAGEEEHILVSQYLHQVMIEIACLLLVVQDEEVGAVHDLRCRQGKRCEDQGGSAALQSAQRDGVPGLVLQAAGQGLYLRMSAI